MSKYILASASPRRKELLKQIIKKFDIVPSGIDEKKIKARTPQETAVKTALAKALDVALKYDNSIVIGADTVVLLGGKVLGKPKSKKDAIKMLKELSGTTHKVITGLAIVDSKGFKVVTAHKTTKVIMRKVSDDMIAEYVESGSPMDKAGGYGIQEIEDKFIKRINGDFNNVVGLPVKLLSKLLGKIRK